MIFFGDQVFPIVISLSESFKRPPKGFPEPNCVI